MIVRECICECRWIKPLWGTPGLNLTHKYLHKWGSLHKKCNLSVHSHSLTRQEPHWKCRYVTIIKSKVRSSVKRHEDAISYLTTHAGGHYYEVKTQRGAVSPISESAMKNGDALAKKTKSLIFDKENAKISYTKLTDDVPETNETCSELEFFYIYSDSNLSLVIFSISM